MAAEGGAVASSSQEEDGQAEPEPDAQPKPTKQQAEAEAQPKPAKQQAEAEAQPKLEPLGLKQRAFAGYMLTISYGVQYVGEFFCRQTKEQLWLTLFAGDTVALGVLRGQLFSLSQILGFLITPMLGGLSDSFGRRPVLILGSLLYQIATLTVLATRASLGGLITYEVLFPIAARAMGLPNRAGFGDLFSDDPKLFTKFMAKKELIIPVAKMVVPILGGLLARRSIMLPFQVALAIGCVNVIIPVALLPESLQPDKRKPFDVAKSLNPLVR